MQIVLCKQARLKVLIALLAGAPIGVASGQTATPAGPVNPDSATATAGEVVPDKPPLKQEELDQLLAPIALYPDSLLTQILMASTYPLEIVQAARWATEHKELKDAALTAELEKQSWDASVKSLVNFPQVLAMMNEKLELTMKLGDAFIAQQADVMNTIQNLRAKAKGEGQLASNEQQKIVVEAPPPQTTTVVVEQVTPPPTQIIRIEPAQPEVIYVPTYSPTVVYGTWPYPAYPPAPYYPPGYVASNMVSFGVGVACGAAWGYAWGHSDWGHNDVDIDIDRNTNINNNIDRSKYKNEINRNNVGSGNRTGQGRGGGNSWQHNPQHRQGVPYRDQKSNQRYGNSDYSRQAAQSRDAYRGRADSGQRDAARGSGNFDGGNRGASGSRGGTFDSVDRGGGAARAESQRGQDSRSGASASARNQGSGSGSRGSGASRGSGSGSSAGSRGSGSAGSRSGGSSGGSRGGGGGGSRGGGGGGGRGGGGRR